MKARTSQEPATEVDLQGYKPRVLLVDVDPDVTALAPSLRERQYRVEVKSDPTEALEWLKRYDADLLAASQTLNGMTGLEFLQQAGEQRPMAQRLLLVDSYDEALLMDAINSAQLAALLTKPIGQDTFIQALNDLLPLVGALKERDRQIEENELIISELRRMNYDLEARIKAHTDDLEHANDQLRRSLEEISKKNKALTLLNQSLNIQATVDPLTGLFNRREFQHRLEAEWARYRRHGLPLSVMMIDIDHFKAINDTYGHDGGDVVLQSLALTMKGHQRRQDVVCRYGGEEFVIILPDTELEAAFLVADKLRKRVASEAFRYKDHEITVHVSLGVSGAAEMHPANAETLVEIADAGLYKAKASGRNRAVVVDAQNYDQIVMQGSD